MVGRHSQAQHGGARSGGDTNDVRGKQKTNETISNSKSALKWQEDHLSLIAGPHIQTVEGGPTMLKESLLTS